MCARIRDKDNSKCAFVFVFVYRDKDKKSEKWPKRRIVQVPLTAGKSARIIIPANTFQVLFLNTI